MRASLLLPSCLYLRALKSVRSPSASKRCPGIRPECCPASPAAQFKLEIGSCTNPKRLTCRPILRSRLLTSTENVSLMLRICSPAVQARNDILSTTSKSTSLQTSAVGNPDWHLRIPNVLYARASWDSMTLMGYHRVISYRDSKYSRSPKSYHEITLSLYFVCLRMR